MEHGAMSSPARNRPTQEDLHPPAGWLAIAAQARRALEFRQQVEHHQNAQEGRLGGIELFQAEIIRRPVRFQL